MIEARMTGESNTQTPVEKPQTITVTMIIEDLNNGIDRLGIQAKYSLEKWEVSQMFQHPALKGKKAKKVRKLSFDFVDDTVADPNQTSIAIETTDAVTMDDVDVHTEASMTVEATPELQEEDPFIGEYGQDDEKLEF